MVGEFTQRTSCAQTLNLKFMSQEIAFHGSFQNPVWLIYNFVHFPSSLACKMVEYCQVWMLID